MVDLLPLELEEDITLFKDLLKEFNEKTGSEVAADILNNFETLRQKIVKVFPQEYQRALKQMAEQSVKPEVEVKQTDDQKVKDIEDSIPDQTKLDKVRGFMKYKRIKGYYRDVSKRSKDWKEIFDHQFIRNNVRTQASRSDPYQ